MKRQQIEEILRERGISPNKKLGQNFLVNPAILERIAAASGAGPAHRILEIGPGLGFLTEFLCATGARVTAVEVDAGLYRYLREYFGGGDNPELVHADFFKYRPEGEFDRVVANLPYYCSSEILFTLARAYRVPEIYVMLQREMAERVVSSPGSEAYGAMAVTMGFYFTSRILFHIDRHSFYPQPDVQSSFLALQRRESLALEPEEIELFHGLVKSAFWGRRKTLRRALSDSPHLSLPGELLERSLAELGVAPSARGETLGWEEYAGLARILRRSGHQL